jgi:thiol-disulfide isomerase/thioredoxin
MPDFALASREGPPRRLSSFTQPTLVVNFWATWCAPCRREIPLLKTLRSKRAASGVEIVGIAVDFREDVLKYAVSAHIDYPLLIGEQDGLDAANAFGMDMVFPFTVFADAKRRVIAVKVGELHENEADFILDRIADVNNGRLAADNARKLIAEQLRLLAAQRSTPRTPPAPGAAPAS